jgi:ferritin-like metal-binding protein YciE
MGNLAALSHAPMQDEILKNTFANYAFEHMEIAAYRSLITMAEVAGDTASVPALTQSLNEEIATAEFIEAQIAPTTMRYMQLTAAGETAGV